MTKTEPNKSRRASPTARAWLGLALAAASLTGGLFALSARHSGPPKAAILPLLSGERLAAEPVAGLSLQIPGDPNPHYYLRTKGRWVCASTYKVSCNGAALEAFLAALLAARGMERAATKADWANFGLEEAASVHIALHGRALLEREDRDVLASAAFSWHELEAGESAHAFARRQGEERSLETGFVPRAWLRPVESSFPPFVDARLVPQPFPPQAEHVEKVLIAAGGQTSLELVRTPHEVAPEASGVDALPFAWNLVEQGILQAIDPRLGEAYATFLLRAPFVGLDDPRKASTLLEGGGRAQLTLFASGGSTLVLAIGAKVGRAPDGSSDAAGFYVWNEGAGLLAVAEAQMEPMLLPRPADFTAEKPKNPWDEWLRAELAK